MAITGILGKKIIKSFIKVVKNAMDIDIRSSYMQTSFITTPFLLVCLPLFLSLSQTLHPHTPHQTRIPCCFL